MDRVHALYAATVWRVKNESDKLLVHAEPTLVRESELHFNMEKSTWEARTLLEVMYFHVMIVTITFYSPSLLT